MHTELRKPIEEMTPLLRALGLLTDAQVDEVDAILARTRIAERAVREHETLAANQAAELGAELATRDDLNVENVLDAALAMPARSEVEQVADRLFMSALAEARKAAYANVGKLPAKLNAEHERIRADFAKLDLKGAHDAQSAIDLKVTDAWQKFIAMRQHLSDLRSIAQTARFRGLIPAPIPTEEGPFWRYRLPVDPDAASKYGTSEVGKFRAELARQPFCAESREQARAVAESWNTGAA